MTNHKKCPFCGKTKVKLLQGASEPTLVAVCANCGAQAPKHMRASESITEADKQQAFALWQHRALEVTTAPTTRKPGNGKVEERFCKGCGTKFLVGGAYRPRQSRYCSIKCMERFNGKKKVC